MDIFETLSKLRHGKRKPASYIYLDSATQNRAQNQTIVANDEQDNQIKEIPLSKLDSAGSALINKAVKKKQNPAKLIHDSIFGKP